MFKIQSETSQIYFVRYRVSEKTKKRNGESPYTRYEQYSAATNTFFIWPVQHFQITSNILGVVQNRTHTIHNHTF